MAAGKPSAKKAAAKKPAAKKAARKAVPGTSKRRPSVAGRGVSNYAWTDSGILVPQSSAIAPIVPAGKLAEGIEKAKGQISKTLGSFAKIFTQDFEITEIELCLSFSADGKFLGFGAGGELSVTVRIAPVIGEG